MKFDEHNLPCLYMLWPAHLLSGPPRVEMPAGYIYRSYAERDKAKLHQLFESEGWSLADNQWQDYMDKILPGGLFLIIHDDTGLIVATAGAAHNPNPGRYHFPFGGELGYLVVHPRHRGARLGQVASALVVQRFIEAGYENIRVCVKGFRLPAIKTYLNLGFVPFIQREDTSMRWKQICEQLDWPFEPAAWPAVTAAD